MFDEQPDADPHGECAAEIHRLVWQLALILPMAKAHAAAHPVGSNADIVRRAEEVLREHVPPNDGLGAIPVNEGKAGDDGGKGVIVAEQLVDVDALRQQIADLGYHHSASHITPDYRDGFNRAIEEVCGLLAERAEGVTASGNTQQEKP